MCVVPNFVFPKKLLLCSQSKNLLPSATALFPTLLPSILLPKNLPKCCYFVSCLVFSLPKNLLPYFHTQLVSNFPTFPNVVILFPIVAVLFPNATHFLPNIQAFVFALASFCSRVVLHERGMWVNTSVTICLCSLFLISLTFVRN